jgi:uncharacterized protein with PIN domain
MVTYVLDTSALLRFIDDEAGCGRVGDILIEATNNLCRTVISSVNWGELVSIMAKRQGVSRAKEIAASLLLLSIQVENVGEERANRAGIIRHSFRIPYADCFGVELASDSPNHILVTADFDAKPAEHTIRIEFLPTKSNP